MTRQPHILMCPPDFYAIEYEINPWMNRRRQADNKVAQRQWQQLNGLLIELGAKVSLLEPIAGLPDLVFTANAALIYQDIAILTRFRHAQRKKEEDLDEAWLLAAGFDVKRLPDELCFEGAGDALFCGDTLFAGYRTRSDAQGHQQIGELISHRVIPMELVDPYYYHLDTCFCPLANGVAIYFPGAFDDYGRRVISELVDVLVEVDEEEARSFACNAVMVGRTVVTNIGCPRLHASLKQLGFNPLETPLGEFVKSGGSAKCLTLRLDGEEAALWKNNYELKR